MTNERVEFRTSERGPLTALSQALAAASTAEAAVAIGRLEQRTKLYGIALDRLLGLPDGSIELSPPGRINSVIAAGRVAGSVAGSS